MNKKTVTIKFEPRVSGRKAAQVIIKDLNDAIAINQGDYEFLEEMKREFVFGIMGIEKLQAKIKYPDLMESNLTYLGREESL